MFLSYFNTNTSLLFITGVFFLLLASFQHFMLNKEKLSVLFLILGSSCFFFFAISLDTFIHLWDERFHALVAKNIMTSPLKPTLYNEVLFSGLVNYENWANLTFGFTNNLFFL